MRPDLKSAKKTVKLSVFFMLLGSVWVKAACRMLMKLTPDVMKPFNSFLERDIVYKQPLNLSMSNWRSTWRFLVLLFKVFASPNEKKNENISKLKKWRRLLFTTMTNQFLNKCSSTPLFLDQKYQYSPLCVWAWYSQLLPQFNLENLNNEDWKVAWNTKAFFPK